MIWLYKFKRCTRLVTVFTTFAVGALLKIRDTNIQQRMDIPSSSIAVRTLSWKWAFQPCWIYIWIRSNLSFAGQINIHPRKKVHFQEDILTAMDVCFILTWSDIYLTYKQQGWPYSNGYPTRLECSFSGWYSYCDGGWRNIHPRLDDRKSILGWMAEYPS